TVPASILWDGGPTGQGTNWLDPVNWVGDALPGPNDDAVIGPAAPGQPSVITLTGDAAVHSATITGGTLSVWGTLSAVSLSQSGGTINVGAGSQPLGYGPVTVSVGTLSQSGGKISVGVMKSLNVNGAFSQTGGVLGVTVASQPTGAPVTSQIRVGGTVALGGSLNVDVLSYGIFPNQSYRILDNVGSDPVSGTFAGLPEGGKLMAGAQRVNVSYLAGTDNDVVLR